MTQFSSEYRTFARASGTEDVVRIYCEGPNYDEVKKLSHLIEYLVTSNKVLNWSIVKKYMVSPIINILLIPINSFFQSIIQFNLLIPSKQFYFIVINSITAIVINSIRNKTDILFFIQIHQLIKLSCKLYNR